MVYLSVYVFTVFTLSLYGNDIRRTGALFRRAFSFSNYSMNSSSAPSPEGISFPVPWDALDVSLLFDLIAAAPRSFPDVFLVLSRSRPLTVQDLRVVLLALEHERIIEKNYFPTRNGDAPYAISYSAAIGSLADLRLRALELATTELVLSCARNALINEAVLRSIRERSGRCFIELRAASARAVGNPSLSWFDVALHLVDLYRSGSISKQYWNLDGFAMETYTLPE